MLSSTPRVAAGGITARTPAPQGYTVRKERQVYPTSGGTGLSVRRMSHSVQ